MPITTAERVMFGMLPNAQDIKYSIALKDEKQDSDRVKIRLGEAAVTIFDHGKVHKLLI